MYSAQGISAATFLLLSFLAQIGSEKSLFDDLPLNGALVEPSGDSTRYSVSSSRSQDVSWGRRQSRQSQHGHHQQETPSQQRHDSVESETDLSKSSGPSLFDELPNQGALSLPKSSRNRSPRDSQVSYDVTPVKPSQEFDVPFWDNRLINPIVNSISNSPRPINPSFRLPFSSPQPNYGPPRGPPLPQHHHHNGGSYHQNHNTAYGPPPPPSPPNFSHHPPHPPKSFSFNYNKHHHHHPPPPRPPSPPTREEYKNPKGNHQVTATSGGPTVIVYAHPKKETSPGSSSSSYNPPNSGYPESNSETTDAPVKNEIHYHYHINKGETPTTPIPADESSGGGYSYPAPSSYYRPANQRRNHKSMGPPRRPPPHQHYGPPPNRFKGGGSNPNDLLNDEEDEVNRRTFFSVSSGKKRPADSVSFVGSPSTSYEVPPAPNAPSGSFSDGPSTAYGPPSDNPPETSYGPPTSPPPPANPPAPPPPQQDSESDQFETTLTLQTIPVTRTVTELVQVPNVVYKVSSNRPSASSPGIASLDEPNAPPVHNPPSTAYGAPAPPPARNRVPQLPNMDSNRVRLAAERPFESHLEQILGVSPTQNSRDAVLQELLLGQARNPGSFDLTLSDLELISLLQNSRGGQSGTGGMFSNTGTQFPILNPGRQSLGSRLFGNGRGMSSAFSSLFGGGGGTGGGLGSILQSGSSSSLTGGNGGSDSLSGLREAFREQRFQLALQDLRKQLREQNKENVRERSGYRSLFTRGALLLSALTLLPSVVSPMASAAGVGSAAASVVPNFMLPVTAAGRRKRDLGFFGNGLRESPFEICLRNSHVQGIHKFQYEKWINCASNLSLKDMESLAGHNRARTQGLLYDLRGIENDIKRYIPARELVEASTCVQRDLCENIVKIKNLPQTNSLALLYSLFQGNISSNRWIQESVSAAVGRNKCQQFHCPSNKNM